MDSVWLSDYTWQEVEDYLKTRRTIIVPVGATEQHGPAGPLGVDTLVAMGLAEDAARETQSLVAPPLWVSDSFHHRAFPGSLWLRSSTFIAVITDIAASLAQSGFTRQIYVNGHKGSNLPALTLALRELREYSYPQALVAVVDPLNLGKDVADVIRQEPEHHGGALELSEVMYRFPGSIRVERLGSEAADLETVGGGYLRADIFGKGTVAEIPWTSQEQRAFAPSGAIGASKSASVELGQKFHDAMVHGLVEFVQWFERYDGPLGASGGAR